MEPNQMHADMHMLTAPLRLLAELILLTLVILSFPLICLGLLVAAASLSSDEVQLLRVALFVFGPCASCIWFCMTVRLYQRNDFRVKYGVTEPRRYGVAAWYAFMGFLISLLAGGYVAFTQDDSNPTLYFLKAVVACFSPSLLYIVYRIFRKREHPVAYVVRSYTE